MADGLYLQLDVMRMPEPKEFRRLRQHRATPFPQIWPFRIPNLDYPGHVVLNVWHTCFIDDESFRNNLKYNI